VNGILEMVMRPAYGRPGGSADTTLAEYLQCLEPGSPCLCCGSPLLAHAPAGHERSRTLLCPWCRAEVTGDEGPALAHTVLTLVVAA
jgi:hypothetical protein